MTASLSFWSFYAEKSLYFHKILENYLYYFPNLQIFCLVLC